MGLVLPSRCALLDRLFKTSKSALMWNNWNNQYAPSVVGDLPKKQLFTSLPSYPVLFFPLLDLPPLPPSPHHASVPALPQAEQASLSHILDLLSLVLLSAIWALCPRDSLAVLGHWVQQKLSQVSSRVLLGELFHT